MAAALKERKGAALISLAAALAFSDAAPLPVPPALDSAAADERARSMPAKMLNIGDYQAARSNKFNEFFTLSGNDVSSYDRQSFAAAILLQDDSRIQPVEPVDGRLQGRGSSSGGQYSSPGAGLPFEPSESVWLDVVGLPTSQSSTGWNGLSGRAVDGNLDSAYFSGSCTHTQVSTKPWWKVTLGSKTEVTAVKVTNRGDCCESRLNNLVVLVDGQPCASGVSFTRGETKVIECDAPVTGTVVQLELPGKDRVLTLCEVGVKARRIGTGLNLKEVVSIPVVSIPPSREVPIAIGNGF